MTDEKRPYRKKRRAELEEQTRLRITESAVELHGTLGPSRTSMSAIAEHAGVRRSTLYRHFPDEVAVFDRVLPRTGRADNPPPDLGAWAAIEDPDERLATALGELYAYYRSGEPMLANLHRDEALVPTVRQFFGAFHEFIDRGPRRADARTWRARQGTRSARSRRDRPRARVRHLAARSPARKASTTPRPPSSCAGWCARRARNALEPAGYRAPDGVEVLLEPVVARRPRRPRGPARAAACRTSPSPPARRASGPRRRRAPRGGSSRGGRAGAPGRRGRARPTASTAAAVRQATRAPMERPPAISGSPASSPVPRCSITAIQAASSCRGGAGARRPATL